MDKLEVIYHLLFLLLNFRFFNAFICSLTEDKVTFSSLYPNGSLYFFSFNKSDLLRFLHLLFYLVIEFETFIPVSESWFDFSLCKVWNSILFK